MCMKNCEKQVKDALRSITQQDFPHDLMEVILVDDGSEDSTLSIVNNWKTNSDLKIKIFSYGWRGIGKCRNTIFENAEGEFILWVDSDEILSKSYVRNQVDFMKKDPKLGIAVGTPGLLNTWSLALTLEILVDKVNCKIAQKPRNFFWKSRKLPGTGGAIYRKEALEQVNGFDERLSSAGEDVDVARRIENIGWQISINSHLFYETHGGFSTIYQLLKRYFYRGYGNRIAYVKNKKAFSLIRISPIGSIVASILYSIEAYKLTSLKKSFLITVHFSLKMIAWFFGFIKSQITEKS